MTCPPSHSPIKLDGSTAHVDAAQADAAHAAGGPPAHSPAAAAMAAAHASADAAIDYQHFLECVHCGLCTAACPTYTELGDENDSPRGRIYLMRLVADGRMGLTPRVRKHLDLCLDCRACETACPSGVHYGRLIEPFRLAIDRQDHSLTRRLDWFRELILLRVFPYADRMRRLTTPVRILQRLGIYGLAERLGILQLVPGKLGRMARLLPPLTTGGGKLPAFVPAIGRRRARVAFFVGCVADAMFRHVHWATIRVLQHNGCDVIVPDGQGCCGAIHHHSGDSAGARRMAEANLKAFDIQGIDAVVVNHAGCGAMLREYGHHWDDPQQPARAAFAGRVRDVHEFLDALGPVAPEGRIEATATYHDACHLAHAQRVVQPPRRLLQMIPGLELRPLPESEICCGSAGTYNLNQAAMADRLLRRKVDNILRTGAEIVLAANAGCLLQIGSLLRQQRLPLTLLHPMELLDLSYREQQPQLARHNGKPARPAS